MSDGIGKREWVDIIAIQFVKNIKFQIGFNQMQKYIPIKNWFRAFRKISQLPLLILGQVKLPSNIRYLLYFHKKRTELVLQSTFQLFWISLYKISLPFPWLCSV